MRAPRCRSVPISKLTAALKLCVMAAALAMVLPLTASAQTTQSSTSASFSPQQAQPFKPEELDALLSPVALYPDNLIAQICMASTYPQLVAARMAVGIGEAGGVPPSYAILSDYFPPGRRGVALGLFNFGPPLRMRCTATSNGARK